MYVKINYRYRQRYIIIKCTTEKTASDSDGCDDLNSKKNWEGETLMFAVIYIDRQAGRQADKYPAGPGMVF